MSPPISGPPSLSPCPSTPTCRFLCLLYTFATAILHMMTMTRVTTMKRLMTRTTLYTGSAPCNQGWQQSMPVGPVSRACQQGMWGRG